MNQPQHQINGLAHVAIVVADLERAIEFYQNTLGLHVSHREQQHARGLDIAFIPIGETYIELIAPMHDQSEVSRFLDKRGGGLHHLAFEVQDATMSYQYLHEKGVQMASKGVEPGAHGCAVAFVHPKSTGGTLIEISQPPQAR